MNNTIYCFIINNIAGKSKSFRTKVRPQKGDRLLLTHTKETVKDVIFVTDMAEDMLPDCKGHDLVVYTK